MMDAEKLEHSVIAPEDIILVQKNNVPELLSEIRPHYHSYWELKVFSRRGNDCISIAEPEAVHGETPRGWLKKGWVLCCHEPVFNLLVYPELQSFYLPYINLDALCPGGFFKLVEKIFICRRERLFNSMLSMLWSAVATVKEEVVNQNLSVVSIEDRVQKFIEEHYYQKDLSVEKTAKEFGVTAGYLANVFKKKNLGTVRQFIIKTRLQNAVNLLGSKNYSVKEVADMTGWSNQFYFSNVFSKHFGFPPSRSGILLDESTDYL